MRRSLEPPCVNSEATRGRKPKVASDSYRSVAAVFARQSAWSSRPAADETRAEGTSPLTSEGLSGVKALVGRGIPV